MLSRRPPPKSICICAGGWGAQSLRLAYGPVHFKDEPGAHDPCYVVMPGGAMLELNHHAGEGVDIARAKFIVAACNAALHTPLSAQEGPKP